MARPAAVYSRAAIQRLAPPAQRTQKEQRQAALGLIKDFQKFAEVACGCTATSNRVNLRHAVFHATQDIDLEPFVHLQLQGDMAPIESIARMECPVTLPDRTMLKVKVKESAPKRIVYAAKALRRHLSLTETQTCRGCSKRSRCRFFKAPADGEGENAETGVRHVGRVVFGMAQYARAHLQQPEAYPFYFSEVNLDSAKTLMKGISAHLVEEHDGPLYREIERAATATASEVLLREAQRKAEKRQADMEERVLSLPQWMRDALQPVPGPGMTRKQRALLGEASDTEDAPEVAPTRRRGVEDESGQWYEEGATPGEPMGSPLASDPHGPSHAVQPPDGELFSDGVQFLDAPGERGDMPITNIDGIQDMPVPQRFRRKPPSKSEQPVVQYNSLLGGHTAGIFRLGGEELGHRIDLDGVAGEELDAEGGLGESRFEEVPAVDAQGVKLRGGYSITDLMSPEAGPASQEALQLLSLSPGALEGVHHYNVGAAPKRIDPKIVEDLWNRAAEGKDELPFLTRIPFDSGPGRSGGTLPPTRLPSELVLEKPQPIVPPPRHAPHPSRSSAGSPVEAVGVEDGVVELDSAGEVPRRDTEEDFALDEALARRSLRERAGRVLATSGPAAASRTPSEQAIQPLKPVLGETGGVAGSDPEDRGFAAWSGRQPPSGGRPPRAVGVLNPSVDFGTIADAGRIERVGQFDAENMVTLGQRKPLPQDEAFVSTFRRPLTEPLAVGEDGTKADPLGAAAPGIDIEEIRAEVAGLPPGLDAGASSGPAGLEEEGGFIIGGSIKFPKLPTEAPSQEPATAAGVVGGGLRQQRRTEGSPQGPGGSSSTAARSATQRLPPRLGRLRQARLQDLSDLLKPGASRSPAAALPGALAMRGELGEVSHPDDGSGGEPLRRPRSADEQREDRNVALAQQQQLCRHMKNSMQKQYPKSRPYVRGPERDEGPRGGSPRRRSGSPVLDLAGR